MRGVCPGDKGREKFGAAGLCLVIHTLDYSEVASGHSLLMEKEHIQEKPADQSLSSPAASHLDHPPPCPLPLAE